MRAGSLRLAAELSEVGRLNEWLELQAQRAGAPKALVNKMKLCLDEVVTNIVSYAFSGIPDPELTVALEAAPEVLTVVVVDNGAAFDPLGHPLAPRLSDLKTAPIGGFGIRLLRETASALGYERVDGRNRLTITCRAAP